MRRSSAIFIAGLLVASLAAAEDGADGLGLWRQALAVFQKNSDWVPGRMSILSELLDRKGRPDSVTQMVFSVILSGRDQARTELLQAVKDGKDVTAEMREKMASNEEAEGKSGGKKDSFSLSLADSPFNPDRQQQVTVRPAAETQLLFERTCRRFDFSFATEIVRKGRKEKLTWIGKAWLDEGSGVPVKLEFSFEPLPKHVYNLWTIYLYETTAAGDWQLKEITVQGRGGFLFIKKGFRSTTRFGDYRRQMQAAEAK